MVSLITIGNLLERWVIMKVKVRNTVYNSEVEPVMVILTDKDKAEIENMMGDRYCGFPEWLIDDHEKMLKWMEEE